MFVLTTSIMLFGHDQTSTQIIGYPNLLGSKPNKYSKFVTKYIPVYSFRGPI
jgi:hypothetical protein